MYIFHISYCSSILSQAAINFYCQEKMYRHMYLVALEAIKKYGTDPVLLFFKAYALILEGKSILHSINFSVDMDAEYIHAY